jgi:probable F420-dependent oxidoreductase
MRYWFADAMINPSIYLPLATAVENAGFDGMTVPDSLCYPEVSDSTYPYTPDGNRAFLEDKPFIDPFVLIASLGAVTKKLRFCTFVTKLPIRDPVIVAKQATSLAVMTNNRFDFGVGTSPWPDDYRVTATPWKGRGKRMDEIIAILRGLETGDYYRHQGEVFDVESIKICPAPSKRVPILIGGHSGPALRRAASVGDGWLHAGGDPTELSAMVDRLQSLRRDYGRTGRFDIRVISPDAYHPDGVKRLTDAGVTDVIVGFRNAYSMKQDRQNLDDKVKRLEAYADTHFC